MKYSSGSIGRVFVARLEDGDDVLVELKRLLDDEKVDAAVAFMIGALKEARMVVGPKVAIVPPDPVWTAFEDGREILAIATGFRSEGEMALHIHAGIGRGDQVLTGCIRDKAQAYLTLELIVLELQDTGAVRLFDPATGIKLLDFAK